MGEIGGVVLGVAPDLQPLSQQHGTQFGHQLLMGIGTPALIPGAHHSG